MNTRSVRFRLFGPLGVDSDAGSIDLGPLKQRAVLGILLLHANKVVSVDRIVDLVWGENPPRTAAHSVQIYVSNLRRVLSDGSQAGLIETRPPGYLLNVASEAVDVLRFERLIREGLTAVRAGKVAEGSPMLEHAVASWTAAPLAEFTYDDFAHRYISSLEELRLDGLEALAGVHLDQGNLERARELARQAIEADPLRDEPRRLIMLALYRSGRQAEAIRHFGEYRKLLGEDLGLEPSDHLRELEERVLLQDPSLSLLAPTETAQTVLNPYRGLRPFSEGDADVYFGRETLVAEVLEKLDAGSGFVSIIGPSGSGKSSAVQAGAIPVLRAQGERVVLFTPGPRPVRELATALDGAGFGAQATLQHRLETDARALADSIRRPVVLVIDQFEELFTLADPETAIRFAELVAAAVEDGNCPLRVVATLRADYYDRPLSIPALAAVFSDSVVSVKPMTAPEIERAVVEPARVAGLDVEPALLAQLVADMGGKPGALPLFQFTLFELFERSPDGLTLAHYQELGGLQGALTSRADELLGELNEESRDLVEQLMVRMIHKGRSTSTARPVALRDLLDLDVDPVALQAVLEAFGSRRLLTFNRDASRAAVVELAHEYLITEWPQLASWIEEHSEDLNRLDILDAGTEEWVTADRSEDYLLRGERLKGFEDWRAATTLRLTKREKEFLDSSVALRDRPSDVILWAPSVDATFGRLIHTGLNHAVERHGVEAEHFVDDLEPVINLVNIADRLSRGTPLMVLTSALGREQAVRRLIEDYPATVFLWLDYQESLIPEVVGPNEKYIISRNEELGFLAGVAAGHKSMVDHVGIVVGWGDPAMQPFHEGFEQGVAYADPTTRVSHVYLSRYRDGFTSETLGWLGARVLIDEGVDIVFHAAGRSGVGVFDAIYAEAARTGRQLWAIGVDEDEHAKFDTWKSEPWADQIPLAGWQEHILTSIIKRLDVVVYEGVDNYLTTGDVGEVAVSIANGGIDYVTTGGHVDDIVPLLEAAKVDIRSGLIQVTLNGVADPRYLRDLLPLRSSDREPPARGMIPSSSPRGRSFTLNHPGPADVGASEE